MKRAIRLKPPALASAPASRPVRPAPGFPALAREHQTEKPLGRGLAPQRGLAVFRQRLCSAFSVWFAARKRRMPCLRRHGSGAAPGFPALARGAPNRKARPPGFRPQSSPSPSPQPQATASCLTSPVHRLVLPSLVPSASSPVSRPKMFFSEKNCFFSCKIAIFYYVIV